VGLAGKGCFLCRAHLAKILGAEKKSRQPGRNSLFFKGDRPLKISFPTESNFVRRTSPRERDQGNQGDKLRIWRGESLSFPVASYKKLEAERS